MAEDDWDSVWKRIQHSGCSGEAGSGAIVGFLRLRGCVCESIVLLIEWFSSIVW